MKRPKSKQKRRKLVAEWIDMSESGRGEARAFMGAVEAN